MTAADAKQIADAKRELRALFDAADDSVEWRADVKHKYIHLVAGFGPAV